MMGDRIVAGGIYRVREGAKSRFGRSFGPQDQVKATEPYSDHQWVCDPHTPRADGRKGDLVISKDDLIPLDGGVTSDCPATPVAEWKIGDVVAFGPGAVSEYGYVFQPGELGRILRFAARSWVCDSFGEKWMDGDVVHRYVQEKFLRHPPTTDPGVVAAVSTTDPDSVAVDDLLAMMGG